jgi:hypothetical protein
VTGAARGIARREHRLVINICIEQTDAWPTGRNRDMGLDFIRPFRLCIWHVKLPACASPDRWRNAAVLSARFTLAGRSGVNAGVRHSPRPPKRGQRLRRGFLPAFAATGGATVGPSFSTITPCQMNIVRQT